MTVLFVLADLLETANTHFAAICAFEPIIVAKIEFLFLGFNFITVHSYNLESSTWDVVPVSSGPVYRYGHSLALHQVGYGSYSRRSALSELWKQIELQSGKL